MGTSQSSHAKSSTKKAAFEQEVTLSVGGRKTSNITANKPPILKSSVVSVGTHNDEDMEATHGELTYHSDQEDDHEAFEEQYIESDEKEVEYESEEEDDEWEERLRILEEAKALKQVAEFFLHPERPVKSAESVSRCFFDRPSAIPQEDIDDSEEREAILADARALKSSAVNYLHPEIGVTSSVACARNYFHRRGAEQEDLDQASQRDQVLADAAALKQSALHFYHPELPVVSNATACGRNYFTRVSAEEYESPEDVEAREQVLEDLVKLKQAAVDYLHPERPVVSDAFVSGRNYYSRYSAGEWESPEHSEERDQILSDAWSLKQSVKDFLHPELPVTTSDPSLFGRNYFLRPSAVQESMEAAEERAQILADAVALKKYAIDYMHPEIPVSTTDPTLFGRNYFLRASAPPQESIEESEEHIRILADAAALKKYARDYLHPENPVETFDPTAFGRCYFSRPSGTPYETEEEADVRAQVLADAKAFKKLAVDFMHPELGVASDPAACGRSFFSRYSAPEYDSLEDTEARAQVMEDMKAFKQLAVDFLHPEITVSSNRSASGRNYFDRSSAPIQESPEDAEERAQILADAAALKKYARDYLHPENPVETSDPTAFGRCYFSRPSGTPYETEEEADVRAQVLADAKAFKKLAVDFMHPELGVASDPAACGRSFFSRYSAPEYDSLEDTEARAQVMEDMKEFKHLAADFLHPECPVRSHIAVARNYFSRFSARAEESPEESEERFHILADAAALKKAARHFYHPEFPVSTSDPCATGRNYFDRPNSSAHDRMIHTFASHFDEDEADHHSDHHSEHLDHFGLDEDLELFYMRETLAPRINKNRDEIALDKDEVGSNLSRSPSSVMLVGLDS